MLLLTGGAGFIGSHFLGAAPSSFKVRCLVRSASASRITPSPSVEIVPFDLLSEGPPDRWLEGVTCVVHLAALLRKQDPSLMERVNVDATRRLVAAAQGAGVKKFVFASTENVLREDLDDAYAATKRRAEEAVRGFANHLILRPSFVYGPGDVSGSGRRGAGTDRFPEEGLRRAGRAAAVRADTLSGLPSLRDAGRAVGAEGRLGARAVQEHLRRPGLFDRGDRARLQLPAAAAGRG